MKGRLIIYVVHVEVTRTIKACIDGLYSVSDIVGIMRGIYHLKFIHLHLGNL